jgi:hypothetical protein
MPASPASMTASASAGSFYFRHEKGRTVNEIHANTKCHRPVPTAGPTRPYSTSPKAFSAIHQRGACLRAAVSTQSASTGVMEHRARTTG